MRFEIKFSGHENIRSTHQKTIEITKESKLSTRGDCIIGVKASSSCFDLPISMKEKLQHSDTRVRFSIKVDNHEFIIKGRGNEELTLTHKEDIVIRKSNFVCPRTLAINCDKASDLIPREMVKLLQNPKTEGIFTIIAD